MTTAGQGDPLRTRAAILDAAEPMLLEGGLDELRVAAVAEAAGVAVGSVYVHFDSKEGLAVALVERAYDLLGQYLQPCLNEDWPAIRQLLGLSDGYLRFHRAHPGWFRLIAMSPSWRGPEDNGEQAANPSAFNKLLVRVLSDIIGKACAEGRMVTPDETASARFLVGAWIGVLSASLRRDQLDLSDQELNEVVAEGRRLVAVALFAQAPEHPLDLDDMLSRNPFDDDAWTDLA